MTGQETGKQRASRIPLDYFKKPDAIQRWKLRLTVLALVVAVGWWLSGLVRSDRGNLMYSRGQVATVHAAWNAECNACHEPFRPIGGNAGVSKLFGHASDQKCETCHAGPPHSSRQIASEVQGCASCHRDHRGLDASLVRLRDSDCTGCHANIAAHVQAPFKPRYANVSRFDEKSHPEFKVLREKAKDPGHLKFNHKLHMSAGMAPADQPANPNPRVQIPYTLAQIPIGDRERYRAAGQEGAKDATNKVQLDCASCHVSDVGDFPKTLQQFGDTPRGTGAHMQPIVYENQCKACHPLTLENGKDAQPLSVPHRLQPDQVNEFLTNTYTAYYLDGNPKLLDAPFVMPLVKPGQMPKPRPELEKVRTVIAEKVLASEKMLYLGKQTCGECHTYSGPGAVTPDSLSAGKAPDFQIMVPRVPDVWYTSARFNHTSHRALNCKDCHARAYPDSPDASTVGTDVMLPGIANCVQCHAPESHWGGKRLGGPRFDCTECHSYHHGDEPLQGIGAAARGAKRKMTVQQFLSGGTK
ncbi:MAG: hypothetical protein K2R98_13205 [Gemmataceae bacterium]|nr:hypothetical protein [Gemmataceae bacterium]